MSDEEIKQVTVQMRNGKRRMTREGEYWTDEDKKKLISAYRDGVSITEIALMLERSESAIYQKVEQLKLCSRNPFSMRKRSRRKKEDGCLCEICQCDRALCPLCRVYQTILEGM